MSDSDSDISLTCFGSNVQPIVMGSPSSTDGSSCSNSSSSTFSDAIEDEENRIETDIFAFVPNMIEAGAVVSRAALTACEEYTTMLDNQAQSNKWGGSKKGKAPNKISSFNRIF